MTVQEQAKEVVERNKGDINDTIKTIDQMFLIYSIINTIHNYERISLDLLTLKIYLQKELQNYKKKNKIIVIKCFSNNKGVCERNVANICKYSNDCMIPKNLDRWEFLKQECEYNQPFSEYEIYGIVKIKKK